MDRYNLAFTCSEKWEHGQESRHCIAKEMAKSQALAIMRCAVIATCDRTGHKDL
jgi:hypothetical protein